MAKLTPAAKGIISLAIIAVAGAAAWHLGIKDLVNGSDTTDSKNAVAEGKPSNNPSKGGLGTKKNPLKVSIVSFHGYAPAIVANGNSLTTKGGSIFEKNGVYVDFVIQDDIPTLSTIFGSETAHCAWRTSDFWAQEHPNLRNAGHDAKAIMVVDNTQGADAIIARDKSIQSIEDLAGKKIGLLQFTPSDGMVIDAIKNSSLSKRKRQTIDFVYINVEEGTAGVRAALEGGRIDAAALWDPDLSLAIKNTNAHVVYSTKTATNLIYDVIVCDKRILDNPANDLALEGFVAGWMEGVTAAEKDSNNAVEALIQTEEFFTLLAKDEGRDFVKKLFDNLVWTGLEDNARILGLAGGLNHYERVYKRFDQIYRAAGALANPNSPVINPQESFEYKYIKRLVDQSSSAKTEAAKPQYEFSEREAQQASKKEAALTKPVLVGFKTGSSDLNKRAFQLIDEEMVPLIDNNGSAYFLVSGNTDSTGSRSQNVRLSKQRAQAVVDYLVKEWDIPRERFVIRGNGPDAPLCDEKDPSAEGLSLDECRAQNRTTRLAIHSR
ncbi:MAG: phosphate ABC transporter substrate-binding/OmpA family protein [Myxococcota bacterium]|nr:phosphate ABC transporter substrate-binding/OmpA family protein [Myxococcota bacterium]